MLNEVKHLALHTPEPCISVASDEPIHEIGKRSKDWNTQQVLEKTSAGQARQQWQKGVQAAADVSVGFHEKCRVGTAWLARLAEMSKRFLALVRNESHILISA